MKEITNADLLKKQKKFFWTLFFFAVMTMVAIVFNVLRIDFFVKPTSIKDVFSPWDLFFYALTAIFLVLFLVFCHKYIRWSNKLMKRLNS